MRSCTMAQRREASIVAAVTMQRMICSPMAVRGLLQSAAARRDPDVGVDETATMRALGTSSAAAPAALAEPGVNQLTPVTLPPGRLRLATRPP